MVATVFDRERFKSLAVFPIEKVSLSESFSVVLNKWQSALEFKQRFSASRTIFSYYGGMV